MLEIENLSAAAGTFRLQDVSLTIEKGQCHAVLGPSGSGKSTLLAAILGTLPPTAGRIELAGADITHWPIERRRLGYVPQQLGLFPHLSVRDNLLYGARACRLRRAEFQPLCERLIEITGIGHLLSRRIATLSGGERQRVALVRALVANPRLVLLDEPFTALNESLRRELWWLVKDLQRERALTVLLVTHDLAEAYFLADQITVLIDGMPAQSGEKATVYRRPQSLAAAHFLGLKNLFPARLIAPGKAECPSLGGVLEVAGAKASGEAWLAIRAEHVALREPEAPPRPDEARLAGRFEAVVDLGEAALLQFRTEAGTLLEVRCGSRVLRKFDLQPGDAGFVGLPARDLFVIAK
ncbi:ABC transporter ATP-binding protein [Sulfuricystis multivorans]|uniref:ABC transporter ATP-binding protein n=1 Tax=Sulfuricystis multivorans TaxID=2211108 RepID=UPI000F83C1BF|nr:ABC transporter ATP-binding protein [Sulfuricystis multivorans]